MKRICKFCGKEYDWEEGQLNWTKNGPGICNGNIRSDTFCSYKCGKKDRLNKSKQTKLKKYGNENYNNIQKSKETCLKKYGVEYITQTIEFKEKSKETCLKKYGTEYSIQSLNSKEKSKQTKKEKYNNIHYNNVEKAKNTCIKRYGVTNPFKSEKIKAKIKKTNMLRYGVDNPMKNSAIKEKSHIIKKSLNKYTKSKEEDIVFKRLLEFFKCVERQYRSEEYPFACDFYIPELNLYIEYQGYWTHGNYKRKILGPFDCNNLFHCLILKEWKEKALTKSSYKTAIDIWTNIDPLKRKIAKENNLNWIEFFSLKDFEVWLTTLS